MKTLLLTLLVMTIMCLDLGYTLQCYNTPLPFFFQTCPKGKNNCFKFKLRLASLELFNVKGCIGYCPKKRGFVCCSTNKCNG
uniref:Three-finger toxin n=1 Tax=Calliophis bivirgatus TaxID=8633 RepID=A0A898IL68_CALBG|nr:three-finger toxin [Calliophis bivirgatus]